MFVDRVAQRSVVHGAVNGSMQVPVQCQGLVSERAPRFHSRCILRASVSGYLKLPANPQRLTQLPLLPLLPLLLGRMVIDTPSAALS